MDVSLSSPPLSFSFSFLLTKNSFFFLLSEMKRMKRGWLKSLNVFYSLNLPFFFFGMSFDLVLFHMLLRGHGSLSVNSAVCSLLNTACRSKHVKWLISLFHDRNLIPINEIETKSYSFFFFFYLYKPSLFFFRERRKGWQVVCITDWSHVSLFFSQFI